MVDEVEKLYDYTSEFQDEDSELSKAYINFMQMCEEKGIPLIISIAAGRGESTISLSNSVITRGEWVPNQFYSLFDYMNLDQEGQEIVNQTIRLTKLDSAVKLANKTMEEQGGNKNQQH